MTQGTKAKVWYEWRGNLNCLGKNEKGKYGIKTNNLNDGQKLSQSGKFVKTREGWIFEKSE